MPVALHEFTPSPGQVPLDQDRVLELGQCCGVDVATLNEPAGCVAAAVLQRVRQSIERQFQLSGPWSRRGEIWTVDSGPWDGVVFVINDRAISHAGQQQYISLPFEGGVRSSPLLMVDRDELGEKRGQLSEEQQTRLSTLLKWMFGLDE